MKSDRTTRALRCRPIFPGLRAAGVWAAVMLSTARAVTPALEPDWLRPSGFFFRGATRYEMATRLEREGQYKAAAKRYRLLAGSARNSANQAYALQKCADCSFKAGKVYAAYTHYKKLLDEYPLLVKQAHVLDRLRAVAEGFAEGRASLFGFKNPSLAAEVYELILRLAPAGPQAADDMLRLADFQERAGNVEEAAATCRDLLRRYPERAAARVRLAGLILEEARAGDGDGRLRREARRELEQFLAAAPDGPEAPLARSMLALVRETLARDRLELGRFYSQAPHRRPAAARRYLHDVLVQYSDTAVMPVARAILARIESMPEPATGEGGVAASIRPQAPAGTVAGAQGPPSPRKKTARPTVPAPRIGPPEAVPFPRNARWIKQQETVKKWLLPLEDISSGDSPDATQ